MTPSSIQPPIPSSQHQSQYPGAELDLSVIAPIFNEKPFFMSEEFTLVDCCLAPILWRLPALGIEFRSNKQTKPLLAYMDTVFNRESFQASLSESEREMRL